jgi:hypothetical protein
MHKEMNKRQREIEQIRSDLIDLIDDLASVNDRAVVFAILSPITKKLWGMSHIRTPYQRIIYRIKRFLSLT